MGTPTFLTEVFARHKRMTGEVAVRLGLGPQGGRVFPSEGSPVNLAKEDWVFRRYLDMDPLWAAEEKPAKSRLDLSPLGELL